MVTQLWEFQDGTDKREVLHGGVVGSNGTYVLAGYSDEDWNGINAGGGSLVFKVDAERDIIWNLQNGTWPNDGWADIIATEEESVVMIGNWAGNPDFYALKLDVDGDVVWQWEAGTDGNDQMYGIAAYDDGSTILAGSTLGNWTGSNRGSSDFAAAKLDVNGNELWRWQDGTPSSDSFSGAAVAGDGSVVLAGTSSGNWSEPNMGGKDFAAVKIDYDGKEIWRWQGGTKEDDEIKGVAIGNDGSVLLTGETLGNWSGETAGSTDFAACKLDANGTELWRWQNGSDKVDSTRFVFVEDDGSAVLIGNTDGSWSGNSYGGKDLAAVKLDVNGGELWRWQADNISETGHRVFIEDVRDAVGDLVEIIQTYKSKGRITQVMTSTLFKRRQEEAEAIIDAAVCRLQLALQVQVGNKMNTLGQDVKEGLCLQLQGSERPELDLSATNTLEARRVRRQRNLDMVEIPEHFVTVTDELLGKGGFGAVYMADYNGRNAAAKVVKVDHDLGRINSLSEETTYGLVPLESKPGQDDSRRKAFWRELQAMRRLRSPHTVQLYGAITSCDDHLVLVMELLPGGDLRTLLKDALEPLDEPHARRIIGDVCAGMAFLHQKEMIHGDLKSPNVLFDGFGRAKIGDFGSTKWPQLTNSTGLATYTTASSESTQMSYAWASPEVLDSNCISYASDVYSFGVVVWEVLSRKIPWAEECRRSIYVRVVIKEHRPEIPVDSPPDLAKVVSACWDSVATDRPTFKDIKNLIPWE